MAQQISDIMNSTMEKVRNMMDANTVVGTPIEAGGVTVVPVCKITIGYGSGSSDFAQKKQKRSENGTGFGGAGLGVNITPISFLVIRDGSVRVVSVEQPAATTVDKVIDLVPGVVDKVESLVKSKKADKAGKAESVEIFDILEE